MSRTLSHSTTSKLARSAKPGETESMRHWREAVRFYEREKPRLLKDKSYRNRFIAIRHKRVVDVDDDKIVLAHRLLERFPDQIFFVTQVLRHEPVYEV